MDSDSSANPDSEILNSVKPGLLTTSGPMFSISSPYARKGELWKRYDENFGPDGDPCVLVAKGSSIDFNNTLPQAVIDRALEKDPVAARSEYLAEFRSDVEEFVSLDAVRACINPNIFERPPQSNLTYHGFVDPSGGSADAMSLAVGHVDMARQVMCVDCIRCVDPPFSPEVCEEFSRVLKSYRISKIIGDKYGGVWCREQFGRFGILYEQSAAPKSDLYLTLLALLNSRRIALLDNKKLVNELVGLERHTARSGRDSIDHAPNGHDDVCNAVAGLAAINNKYGSYDPHFRGWQPDFDDGNSGGGVVAREQARRAEVAQTLHGALTSMINSQNIPFGGGGGRWS